jgi:hypothetical protein
MNYRGFEIKVVVGIDKKWKWSVQLPVGRRQGEARLRNEPSPPLNRQLIAPLGQEGTTFATVKLTRIVFFNSAKPLMGGFPLPARYEAIRRWWLKMRLSEISRSPVAACEPNPPRPLPSCLFLPDA